MIKTAGIGRITQSRVRLLLTKPFFGQLAVRLKIEETLTTGQQMEESHFLTLDFVNSLTDPC